MDINMPLMDGIEATKAIRKLIQNKSIIIAQTAFIDMETKTKSYDAGVDYFITKPIKSA